MSFRIYVITFLSFNTQVVDIKAFANTLFCSGLTSVTIGNSVTSIGSDAFYGCSGLTSITIPNSVTSIDSYAFGGCSGLTSINVESENPKYDSRNNCNAIINTSTNTLIVGCQKTTIPNSVTSIGSYAFYGCSGLTSITIPNSVTSIDRYAFCGCSTLTSITIPNSVRYISHLALAGCDNLTSINVEVGNPKYDSRNNCNAIINTSTNSLEIGCKNTSIPNSVTCIGDSAFCGCITLSTITIPNSVTSIGEYAFRTCSSLTSVTIPNSVTSIGRSAFLECKGLTSIVIPNSVTSIGSHAFGSCSSLASITLPNSVTSIGQQTFQACSSLASITLPNSVTSIGNSAFRWCSSLTSITIPNSVSSIGKQAFEGADLSTVISLIENPFKIYGKTSTDRIFSQNTFNNATLYVPKGTIDKYKATDGWKDFLFIEEGNPAGINFVKNTKSNNNTIYDLNGVRQPEPKKGINIVNGKKVIVK